jgi:AraC-like DNA-binding protein
MEQTASAARFRADPVGRYYVGSTYAIWCASPTLCGSSHWASTDETTASELTELFDFTRQCSLASGHDVVMNLRDVERVHWPAFRRLGEYVRDRLPEWGRRIRRQAVVVPDGPLGAMLAGLIPSLGLATPFPMRFFPDASTALGWLGRADAYTQIAELDGIVAEARGVAPIVRELRAYLDHVLIAPSVDQAALACRVSPRSLQRELHRAGTQFTDEVAAARVRAARALLEHSDDKVDVVARRVGCGSSSRLAALFRRELRETPAAYRARLRDSH